MRIEAGKQYVRRDGDVTGPMKKRDSYAFPFTDPLTEITYTADGSVWTTWGESPEDLVAEHTPGAVCEAYYSLSEESRLVLQADKVVHPGFSHADWDALLEEQIASIKQLSTLKGGEYAGDDDRLANFRRNAQALGLRMEQVWAVYAAKHWDALMQYIKDLAQGKSRERLEPISGRVDDLIVYLLLMKAILQEGEIL